MEQAFTIPIVYQGTEHEFKARFERFGYTHRIAVLIDDTTITFDLMRKVIIGHLLPDPTQST